MSRSEILAITSPSLSEEVSGAEKKGRLPKETAELAQNGHLGGLYRIIRRYWNLQELFSCLAGGQNCQAGRELARLRTENEQLQAGSRCRIDFRG